MGEYLEGYTITDGCDVRIILWHVKDLLLCVCNCLLMHLFLVGRPVENPLDLVFNAPARAFYTLYNILLNFII